MVSEAWLTTIGTAMMTSRLSVGGATVCLDIAGIYANGAGWGSGAMGARPEPGSASHTLGPLSAAGPRPRLARFSTRDRITACRFACEDPY
jgi:hypothetical protein